MTTPRDLLRQLDGPDDDALQRVQQRLEAHAEARRGSKALLRQLAPPSAAQLSALRARLDASAIRRSQRRWTRRLVGGTLAAACALLVWLAVEPVPPPPPPAVSGVRLLDGVDTVAPVADVSIAYGGSGAAAWDGKTVRIDWEVGEITSEVTPEQDIDLSVHTREGIVKVVGTRFTVLRDASGSHVSVSHGTVWVACDGGDDATITAGQRWTCPPVSAGQWLFNVDQLVAAQAPAEDVQASIDRGLRYTAEGEAIRGELLARKVQLALQRDDLSTASAVARQYLDEGYRVRAAQLRPVAERGAD